MNERSQRWPIGRFKFENTRGDGYAIVSLIHVGAVYFPPITEADAGRTTVNYPDPFDLLGIILRATVSEQGPEGAALYALCLVHGSTKAKLVELVQHHPVRIQTTHTVTASLRADGTYDIDSIDTLDGVKIVVGSESPNRLGRVLGLVDFKLSDRELERVLGNEVGIFHGLITDISLLWKRCRTKTRPWIAPIFWAVVGAALSQICAWTFENFDGF